MEVLETVAAVRARVRAERRAGKSIGLVPTMGYLHEGHLSLIRRARAECDFVVVSIFVNPLQFGPQEDYNTYPRDLNRDTRLAAEAGADVIFHPTPEEMYPAGFQTHVEVEKLSQGLCGAFRPGHFRGVATVVTKLFNIVGPDRAYFGEKDAQQLAIIRRMVRDLNLDVEIVPMPIVRESDGLALSSRNTYLSPAERRAATVLYRALVYGRDLIAAGERDGLRVRDAVRRTLESEPLVSRIDYVAVVDPDTLEEKTTLSGSVMLAVAAYIGKVRLIDNIKVVVD
ncbi:MAG: pantoate--beta-alanine ligase [Bacillota bacterium]|nr:pantoate--beta-alanine ligase [Bacillota bacterium]MDK2960162.1 pantoate--beta-alanine ligase [Bacillota bacterium]